MKIAVSYLSSKDYKTSIKKIENSKADFVHCDICDGSYVKTNNFNKENFLNLFNRVNKKLNVHLMVDFPKRYVDMLKGLNIDEIIIHNVKDTKDIIEYIKSLNFKVGIAINPDENVMDFIKYFPLVDVVLVMSVNPGKGGQPFLKEVIPTIEYLYSVKGIYKFNIAIDGGINDETIKLVMDKVDLVISGSFITNSDDYNDQIDKLLMRSSNFSVINPN